MSIRKLTNADGWELTGNGWVPASLSMFSPVLQTSVADTPGSGQISAAVAPPSGAAAANGVAVALAAGPGDGAEIPLVFSSNPITQSLISSLKLPADYYTSINIHMRVSGALDQPLRPGDTAEISVDNGPWADLAIPIGSSNWNYIDLRTLADGVHSYSVRVINSAGNVGATDEERVAVDTQAPTIRPEITSIFHDSGVTGDFVTNDSDGLTLDASLTAALDVTERLLYSRNAGLSWADITPAVTGGTKVSFFDPALTSTATVRMRVVDVAGNVGASDEQLVTIAATPPVATVSIDSYTDDVGLLRGDFLASAVAATDDRTPVLNGSVSIATLAADERIAVYENAVFIGYADIDRVTGKWTYQLEGLVDERSYRYTAQAVNLAGETGLLSAPFDINVDLTVIVNSQTTTDTTPIVTGATVFDFLAGEYLDVTINGVLYSSQNGAVVVDPRSNNWYVQIPDANALTQGRTYDVRAVLKDAGGLVVTQDDTSNELVIGMPPVAPVMPANSDGQNKATAVTIGEDGQWRVFANMVMMDANGTDATNVARFATNQLTATRGKNGALGSASFIDFDRDGYMDLVGLDKEYGDGQAAFKNMVDPNYTQTGIYDTPSGTVNRGYYTFQIGTFGQGPGPDEANDPDTYIRYSTYGNIKSSYGGVAVFDKIGDGYVDVVYGGTVPGDGAGYGPDTQVVANSGPTGVAAPNGMVTPWFNKNYDVGEGGSPRAFQDGQAQMDRDLSVVDINNDGAVDVVFHGTTDKNYLTANRNAESADNERLVVMTNSGTDSTTSNPSAGLKVTQIIENVFEDNDDSNSFRGWSMTWADYNGDGWLDLFLASTQGSSSANENNSKILFNDGKGNLHALNTDGDAVYEGMDLLSSSHTYVFSDKMEGAGSIAVDWNADGRTDIIEVPRYPNNAGDANGNPQPVLLFTNATTSPASVNFTQSTLTTITKPDANGSAISGLQILDIDWDGRQDLLTFTANYGVTLVQSTATVPEGASLHLRILDQQGINALFGNTVKLYDSDGDLVATQVLNPQAGSQTSDSRALVDFYGLDASETYTAVLLRNIGGAQQNVGGVGAAGGFNIQNVNAAWTGLHAGAPTDAYVFTAEAGNASNDANIGKGIVGTGYNDTFFATLGNDVFNGGGGTSGLSDNDRQWSNTGGVDIVDYKLANNVAISVDLSNTGAQNTGFGAAVFVNIEGIAGANGQDVFTDNAGDNVFNGRGGNDTFNLLGGGRDTLLYEPVGNAASGTGGNGADRVNGFTVGLYEATDNADRLDISQLLVGYTPDANGAAHYLNGVATIDAGDRIADFVSVAQSGGNTTISIDRDGLGNAYVSTELLALNGVADTSLAELLANHQIVVG
ncbi:MAG: FG-GAP-like repeat-containing protein [Burkholderiaceae bacterium]|jgi:hypothetical protein|nr:FG-GAP-like repeat-containing protein [Burkholderiaceae bacterium]